MTEEQIEQVQEMFSTIEDEARDGSSETDHQCLRRILLNILTTAKNIQNKLP